MNKTRRIRIFDTTLRDGEQSPGCSMNTEEKLVMARQLEILGVDVMEAGFAAASKGDFEAVRKIAQTVKNSTVATLARAVKQDIDYAYQAVKHAQSPRIHTFIATSDIHMRHKLRMTPDQVVERAVAMVGYAARFCSDIEFSAEDATRSDPAFLSRIFDAVIKAGATVINIPDTVGYVTPDEYAQFIMSIRKKSVHWDKAMISVHCHNDLGMAVANSLSALKVGVGQIECTVNGIGERAGNAALEEIIMALDTRKDVFGFETNIKTKEIMKTSKLLSKITGIHVQPNKAIVGANAFAHESGIHQHGMLADRSTYEIMTPDSIGLGKNHMVLGKHSGKHGFVDRVKHLGYDLTEEQIETSFEEFKKLADKKKTVYDDDVESLVMRQCCGERDEHFKLQAYVINSGNIINNTSSVSLIQRDGSVVTQVSMGDGPIDASYKAIDSLVGVEHSLEDYGIRSLTEGNDAQGEAYVKLRCDGRIFSGVAVSTDVIEASINAYISGLNKILAWREINEEKIEIDGVEEEV